ncbi:MAG: ribosome recycling factor [bacterium]|nr:ribosome recycling factor [bacterium]
MSEFKERLERSIENLKSKLGGIRTGRANPDLLTHINVDYYGSSVPLKQLANISVIEGNTFVLNMYDAGATSSVEKAILKSDLGLNPSAEASVIRMRLPDLTEQRRKDLVKVVKNQSEEGKVALRNIRRDILDELKKSELSEDELKREQETLQKQIESYVTQIDHLAQEKEKEIMTI